jgi:hypothetical protein
VLFLGVVLGLLFIFLFALLYFLLLLVYINTSVVVFIPISALSFSIGPRHSLWNVGQRGRVYVYEFPKVVCCYHNLSHI